MAEVIGLIGAVPGLIQLGKGSLRLYRDVCNGKGTIAKATRGLDSQLELLISVLERIDARLMLSSTPGSATTPQLKALAPMLPQLKADLKELEDTLSAVAATTSGRTTRFFKRTRLIVSGLPKHLEELTQRLSKSVSLMTLELAETSFAMAEGRHQFPVLSFKSGCVEMLIHWTCGRQRKRSSADPTSSGGERPSSVST